eukprot:EC120205.1.p1 GENE.EC120205.1~~EC120205.1.p1  ORF type:complete len:150 (+),score=18.80 EC120205.1:44-451(+)
MTKESNSKKPAPAPYDARANKPEAPAANPLIEKRTRNFSIGNAMQPKRDMSRFVIWPMYIRLQRQGKILYQRLKVPPSIAQFTKTRGQEHCFAAVQTRGDSTAPRTRHRIRSVLRNLPKRRLLEREIRRARSQLC